MRQVLEVSINSSTEWLLTNDVEMALAYLHTMNGQELAVHDPDIIIAMQYQGLAVLSSC